LTTGRGSLTLAAVAIVGATSCGSSPAAETTLKPKPSATPKPSPTPSVDPCLIGRWTSSSLGGGRFALSSPTAGGPTVTETLPVSGGAGAVLTIGADGVEHHDFSAAQPLSGRAKSGEWLVLHVGGRDTAHLHTSPGRHFLEDHFDFSLRTDTATLGAQPVPNVAPDVGTVTDNQGTYICAARQLIQTYDNGEVDTFTR
jgi:hypothetical protein